MKNKEAIIKDHWAQRVAHDYEPFGIPFQKSGWMTNDTHKFTGKPQDSSTGLYYNAKYKKQCRTQIPH